MNKGKLSVHVLAVFVLLVTCSSLAHAQATRTWVSGVGDDANPCSRTAPCKTFAGAISKTAAGGEINVLDPGGFGAVTFTKAITISSWGFEAGVLVSGTNGIVVAVPNPGDIVILRGLDIEGLGTGINGVSVTTGGNVTVENCTINKFTTNGINFTPTVSGSQLHVSNTIVRNNGAAAGTGGIYEMRGQRGFPRSGRAGDEQAAAAEIAFSSKHVVQRGNAGGNPHLGSGMPELERRDR